MLDEIRTFFFKFSALKIKSLHSCTWLRVETVLFSENDDMFDEIWDWRDIAEGWYGESAWSGTRGYGVVSIRFISIAFALGVIGAATPVRSS